VGWVNARILLRHSPPAVSHNCSEGYPAGLIRHQRSVRLGCPKLGRAAEDRSSRYCTVEGMGVLTRRYALPSFPRRHISPVPRRIRANISAISESSLGCPAWCSMSLIGKLAYAVRIVAENVFPDAETPPYCPRRSAS